MLEQNVVKCGALHLDGFRLPVEFALAENKAGTNGGIAQLELCAEFAGEPCGLQRREHAHLAENGHVAREQRFADVKTGKYLPFEYEHVPARPGQKGGRTAAARAATDYQDIVSGCRHVKSFDD